MPEVVVGRDCENPNRGREAYVTASSPCRHILPSGRVITDPVLPANPMCEPVVVTQPQTPCVTVVINGEQTEMIYNTVTMSYSNAGGTITGTYDTVLGWTFTTQDGTFFPPTAGGTNPIGIYSAGNNYISVIACEQASTDVLADCVGMKASSDGFTIDNFNQTSTTLYEGQDTTASLVYTNGRWEYNFGGGVLIGPTNPNNSEGLYEDDNGNFVVIGACNEPVEPPVIDTPNCALLTLADDEYVVDQFTKVSNTFYTANGVDNNSTLEWNGTNWIYTDNNNNTATVVTTLTGPTTENTPFGVYTAGDGTKVFLEAC